jgi:ATP-dependent Lhr-like helicase
VAEAGRWARVRRAGDTLPDSQAATEHAARVLLERYGVVFRRLLEREPSWLPPWYELLKVYRRWEARGEIRGGRFVAGFAGEQYALPEAVERLRAARNRPRTGTLISLSAADPLNLAGILTPGGRVPATASNRLLLRDGLPIAVHVAGETHFLEPLAPQAEWTARNTLLRTRIPVGLRALRQ